MRKLYVPVNLEEWHPWFAWRPVKVYATLVKGEPEVYWRVWWETVERKLEDHAGYDGGYTNRRYRLLHKAGET